MSLPRKDLEELFDGTLPWESIKQIISRPKDDDRFERALEFLQERVAWPERILLPLSERLYVVQKERERIVKCECGFEFGDWRRNWKLSAVILARDDDEKLEEIYPGLRQPKPELCEVREFICPSCGSLLDVESVPVGHPILFDALPDIDAFYRDWLGRELPEQLSFEDRSLDVIREWAETESRSEPVGAAKE
jgi:acetone carboxylase gamma subunit